MLFLVLDYDKHTGILHGVDAALHNNPQVPSLSGFKVALYADRSKCKFDLQEGASYSFVPKDFTINSTFIRGELDYKNPFPKGR